VSADGSSGVALGRKADVAAIRRGARRVAWLYTAAAVFLLPWIVFLAVSLPKRDLDRHYDVAWVGFDLLLAFAVIRTAWFAHRIDPRVQIPATATATLLVVDAWFDVITAGNRSQFLEALLMALLVEVPAAVFSLYLVRRVNRQVAELADFDRLVRQQETTPTVPSPETRSD